MRPNTKKALLGLGLDNRDGQVRLTRGENFTLMGGSEETHSLMRETAVKVNEELGRKGKTLDDVSSAELADVIMDVTDKIGARPPRPQEPPRP